MPNNNTTFLLSGFRFAGLVDSHVIALTEEKEKRDKRM